MNEIGVSIIIVIGTIMIYLLVYAYGYHNGSKSKKIRFVDWNGKVHYLKENGKGEFDWEELKKELESEGNEKY